MPGTIQIGRADVVADIRRLADLTGLPLTEAVAKAVRAQLTVERMRGLAEIRRLPVIGPLLTDDDLYDQEGLPQ